MCVCVCVSIATMGLRSVVPTLGISLSIGTAPTLIDFRSLGHAFDGVILGVSQADSGCQRSPKRVVSAAAIACADCQLQGGSTVQTQCRWSLWSCSQTQAKWKKQRAHRLYECPGGTIVALCTAWVDQGCCSTAADPVCDIYYPECTLEAPE